MISRLHESALRTTPYALPQAGEDLRCRPRAARPVSHPALQLPDRHGAADEVALGGRTAHPSEGIPRALVLDALRHDLQAEAAAQLNGRSHDRRVARFGTHLADE